MKCGRILVLTAGDLPTVYHLYYKGRFQVAYTSRAIIMHDVAWSFRSAPRKSLLVHCKHCHAGVYTAAKEAVLVYSFQRSRASTPENPVLMHM